jgi:HPt (histidine-containing phosphotransfer) domain-containing protein
VALAIPFKPAYALPFRKLHQIERISAAKARELAKDSSRILVAECSPAACDREWDPLICNLHRQTICDRRNLDMTILQEKIRANDALLDPDAIGILSDEVGAERLALVLSAFCHELQRRVPTLDAAIVASDIDVIARETHSIKGSALAFGAPALGNAASDANVYSRSRDAEASLAGARNVLSLIPPTVNAIHRLDAYRPEGTPS